MSQALHVKYRPRTLNEVVGQKEVVTSIKSLLKSDTKPHVFLFTGPSGCGKTTLARILAAEFDCRPENIMEVDAATNTGIDAMRSITSGLIYTGFGETPNKMVVIDECHALSKAAWQSMLKTIEEPAPHVFFALCTTDAAKVPDTVKTRCINYNLKPVKYDAIMDLLEYVVEEEKMAYATGSLELVARACDGSPRMALTQLAKIIGCRSKDEVAELLEAPMEDEDVIDLCRILLKNELDWKMLTDTLKRIPEQNPESIRIVVTNYISKVAMNPRSEKDVPRLLDILAAFSRPCNPTDKMAPILLAFGDIIFR